jgi:hypothetical protein
MAKFLVAVLVVFLASSCQIYTGNMDKTPTRWMKVLDADTRTPVPGVAFVYSHVRRPYFIVSSAVLSRSYVSGADGRVCLPKDEDMQVLGARIVAVDSEAYYVRSMNKSCGEASSIPQQK